MSLRESWVFLKEGARLGMRHLQSAFVGGRPRKYRGTSEEICRRVVEDCWNGHYFQAGLDHLDQFWIRDFAICLEGLIDLGFEDQARACLRWALLRYERCGAVTTTIFHGRDAVDVFHYSSDSFPFLLYALERLDMREARRRFRPLLERERQRYRQELFEADGTVNTTRMFSATKDTMLFSGTCFTHVMAAWCQRLLLRCPELEPFEGLVDLDALVLERFWTGGFFKNDVHSEPMICSGDANFWPFWCGIVEDVGMLEKSVTAVRREGLTTPFPLKYHGRPYPEKEVFVQKCFVPNYQGDSIWTFFSCQWIELAARVDREAAKRDLGRYEDMLQRYGNWWEVFEPDGSGPLQGNFGHGSDWGMLWAASLPRLKRLLV